MNTINKEAILSKTHYGLTIYSHILRLYYPNEVILRLVERDCGLCRNPFNSNKKTLHIWIEKIDPTNAMSKEFARHSDSENAIPAGDAFDFAELHYKQQGEKLLLQKQQHLSPKSLYSLQSSKSQYSQKSPFGGFRGLFIFLFSRPNHKHQTT